MSSKISILLIACIWLQTIKAATESDGIRMLADPLLKLNKMVLNKQHIEVEDVAKAYRSYVELLEEQEQLREVLERWYGEQDIDESRYYEMISEILKTGGINYIVDTLFEPYWRSNVKVDEWEVRSKVGKAIQDMKKEIY